MKLDTVIAANRFGLGARPGELDQIDGNHVRWLKDQLAGPSRMPGELAGLATTPAIIEDVQKVREMRRAARESSEDAPAPDIVREYTQIVRRHYIDQTGARYLNATRTDYPFHERLVHFWANHFAVSADKQPLTALAGAFENEAIRPNIGGRFIDLLLAVEKHPAMILYLDNQRSIGPNSPLGKRANRRRTDQTFGLNAWLGRSSNCIPWASTAAIRKTTSHRSPK